MPKRLIGGLFLLNLTAISLNLSAGETDITDAGVLEQLTNLREFIDEKRDFTKGAKDLKPVLVQYRSSASNIDGIVECNLSFNTDALHLSIGGYSVQADGTPITITINVVYEWTDYVGYTIKSAKINATKSFKVDVINGIIPFEQIEDAQGNKRFVEGDGVPLVQEGYTSVYCKWSLSGTHLMMVVAGVISEDAIIGNGTYLGTFKLPQWIFDKIYPVFGDELEIKEIYAYNDDWTSQNFNVDLNKSTNNTMIIRIVSGGITATKDRQFRIQFDLLIDNAEPEQAGE